MSSEIQAGWSGVPNVQQAVNTGQLKALAVSTSQRLKAMPDVPTVEELGIVDKFDIATVIGLQGPAGMPRDIVAKLQSAVAKALREPDMTERMDRLAMILRENGTENYQRDVAEELKNYAEAVKAAGVKSD
jgi:tripartite-type tricarboxylate transporter receptor subunit TctC